MTLSELFKLNPNIIINTDIDGFLSGMILQTYLGCKIVGFSNSKSDIWVSPEIDDIYKPVYIDLFVNRPDVYCVEQHIIAIDEEHYEKLKNLGTKFNPNFERPYEKRNNLGIELPPNLVQPNRTFIGDYYHKYPFATVHYIIAKLAAEGIKVCIPNLEHIAVSPHKQYMMELGHIILRADDAMFSSLSAYKENADSWWQWLYEISGQSECIQVFRDFISKQDASMSAKKKEEIGIFFKKGLRCDGYDGAFNSITDCLGNIDQRVLDYIAFLKKNFGWSIDIPLTYAHYKGQFDKNYYNKHTVSRVRDIINDPALFSYAFIYGPRSKYTNFSFTLNMEKDMNLQSLQKNIAEMRRIRGEVN